MARALYIKKTKQIHHPIPLISGLQTTLEGGRAAGWQSTGDVNSYFPFATPSFAMEHKRMQSQSD